MTFLLSKLLLLGAGAATADASLAAWWNGIGPQVLIHNDTTNLIRYSACNSYDTPRYNDTSVLSLDLAPKAGTPLAGAGWWTNVITVASVFYITEDNKVANALYNCDMSSGLLKTAGNWIVSDGAPAPHSNTGLAAVLLGDDDGYRVYYHDTDGAINELGYTRKTGWGYRGVISQDINSLPALAAAFSGRENITVATPRDERNIAVTRWNKDETWFRSTLPRPLKGNITTAESDRNDIAVNETAPARFTLPAWDGRATGIGVSIDGAYTRHLWYIGNDASLYTVANQNYTWGLRANQSTAFWPRADRPNGELAVAYEGDNVRIYYMVDGRLSEVKYEDDVWKAWSAVPPVPVPQATSSSTPTSTGAANSDADDGGLSPGAKAGIGVGVSLGAIALGAILAVLVLVRRRKQQQQQQQQAAAAGYSLPPHEDGSTTLSPDATPAPSYGSPALARASAAQYEHYGWDDQKFAATPPPGPPSATREVHQLDAANAPAELYAPQPMYELPARSRSHELLAEPPQTRPHQASPPP